MGENQRYYYDNTIDHFHGFLVDRCGRDNWEKIPILDLHSLDVVKHFDPEQDKTKIYNVLSGGFTGYIDYISPDDMNFCVMKGVDPTGRPFLALKKTYMEYCRYSRSDISKTDVQVFFQRYSKNTRKWSDGKYMLNSSIVSSPGYISDDNSYNNDALNSIANFVKNALKDQSL